MLISIITGSYLVRRRGAPGAVIGTSGGPGFQRKGQKARSGKKELRVSVTARRSVADRNWDNKPKNDEIGTFPKKRFFD